MLLLPKHVHLQKDVGAGGLGQFVCATRLRLLDNDLQAAEEKANSAKKASIDNSHGACRLMIVDCGELDGRDRTSK